MKKYYKSLVSFQKFEDKSSISTKKPVIKLQVFLLNFYPTVYLQTIYHYILQQQNYTFKELLYFLVYLINKVCIAYVKHLLGPKKLYKLFENIL